MIREVRSWACCLTLWIAIFSAHALILSAQPVILLPTGDTRQVRQFEKFEIDFVITESAALNLQWPHDPQPPRGIPAGAGISVDGVFIDPEGREHRQPGFYYQEFRDEVRNDREWHYPTNRFVWKIRFSPNQPGGWRYKVVARDREGKAETEFQPLLVAPSAKRGFVKVSRADPRYFEYEDGTFFSGLGYNLSPSLEEPVLKGGPEFEQLKNYDISLVRMWISSVFGSAWNPYVGARNRYRGYLPVTGLVPYANEKGEPRTLTMRIDYEVDGDRRWFDACRLCWSTAPEAIEPNRNYRISAKYRGLGIEGPRRAAGQYGLVVKLGGRYTNCYEPGTSNPVTAYGRNNSTWGTIQGTWNSKRRNFLPPMYIALENVRKGVAYVREVSVREDFGNGRLGPEIMTKPSMEHDLYIPQKRARALDKILQLAERHGIYLKLVVMEKNDKIYLKMGDDGEFVSDRDNEDGFYGLGRSVNRTRWLQQAWWRYLQARWGYSPNIHSWELTNEGDPASRKHFELADEFGKFMHCRVFGVEAGRGDGAPCTYDHPNDHLVTTSFWHSMPAQQFWANPMYPNVDYADLHAYVSTSPASLEEKRKMAGDAAQYHIWHSRLVAESGIGKPVVRGEAGMDAPRRQDETVLGIQRDRDGLWLHNFLWSSLHSGGLQELYWWKSHLSGRGWDHRHLYRLVNTFLDELDLNRGGYLDWDGEVSNADLRVVGQKNPQSGSMHLWIQNRNHTWRNAADGRQIQPAAGEVRVPGFEPGAIYTVEWWNTYARMKSIVKIQNISADSEGYIKLRVDFLTKDLALTVSKQ